MTDIKKEEYYRTNADSILYANGNLVLGISEEGRVLQLSDNDFVDMAANTTDAARFEKDILIKKDGTLVSPTPMIRNWDHITAVGGGMNGSYKKFYVGLRDDHTLIATGSNACGQGNVSDWENVSAVSCGYRHTAALLANGRVIAAGSNKNGQCNTSGWEDITAVYAALDSTFALAKDGTVLSAGGSRYCCDLSGWTGIEKLVVSEGTISATWNGGVTLAGLKKDGTVLTTGFNTNPKHGDKAWHTEDWENIVSISSHGEHLLGLKKDGTVIAAGPNDRGQCNVSEWRDIIGIYGGYGSVSAGIQSDGHVVYTAHRVEPGRVTYKITLSKPMVSREKLFSEESSEPAETPAV
ncbi:MAG: hypothetical protein LIO75_05080 [Lachnospiraceae bacterium]|nr:hypothetical protein [Lachnospiraceae bacterium]